MIEAGGNEDDGAALMKQVLEENPPEERGVRDEWVGHVGWHRKENVRKRGHQQQERASSAFNNAESMAEYRNSTGPHEGPTRQAKVDHYWPAGRATNFFQEDGVGPRTQSYLLLSCAIILALVCFCRLFGTQRSSKATRIGTSAQAKES